MIKNALLFTLGLVVLAVLSTHYIGVIQRALSGNGAPGISEERKSLMKNYRLEQDNQRRTMERLREQQKRTVENQRLQQQRQMEENRRRMEELRRQMQSY